MTQKLKSTNIERALQTSLKELSDIKYALDVSSIIAITDQKGKIRYVNKKFCEISKYSRQELIGQDHRIINSGYHSKEFMRNLWRTIAQGNVFKGEIKNKAKDGSYYWVDTTIIPFLNEKGRPYQFVAIRNEITQKKLMEEKINQLSQRIIQAQEAERERISREIHDDLGQSLATLKMLIQSSALEGSGDVRLNDLRSKEIASVNAIIEKTRHLASGLRPSTLEVLGLSTAIKTLVRNFKEHHGLDIRMRVGKVDKIKFEDQSINLYRIIQEALTNITKHAKATQVNITFNKLKEKLRVVIKDNGSGFRVKRKIDLTNQAEGLGLSTMKERAKLLKGSLFIESSPKEGTVLTVTVPISHKE